MEKASYRPVSSEVEDRVRKVYLKGVEHYTEGDLEKAIEAWREVLKLDPANEKASSSIKRAEEKLRQTSD
jgi:cytochrome c-type biogenesis protein CcmH/NrfG